ncbi:MAG: hypothetical protein EON55_12735 [Alphaproteobacteria bacterium]|nr:MAG: hypothetical protein EON55_12735 [Alphaproteobacteria bacterium]
MMNQIILDTLDRDGYVAFRAKWKINYKSLSEAIRELRLMTKNQMRAGNSTGGNQNTLRELSGKATDALEHLKEAKARLKEVEAQPVAEAA